VLENIDIVCWDDGKAMKEIDEYELEFKND